MTIDWPVWPLLTKYRRMFNL